MQKTARGTRLLATFLDELEERIVAFNRDLVALEENPSEHERAEIVTSLFRGAHSLKGASALVGAKDIEAVCHRLEDLLATLRESPLPPDDLRFELLFRTADALAEAGKRLRASDTPVSLEPLVLLLESATRADAAERKHAPEREPVRSSLAPAAGIRSAEARDGTVRVTAEKLDALMRDCGDLLTAQHQTKLWSAELATAMDIVRELRRDTRNLPDANLDRNNFRDANPERKRLHARFLEFCRILERLVEHTTRDHAVLETASRRIDADVRDIRMQRFAVVCEGIERIARDAARAVGKVVRLEITGGEVELDRAVLDAIRDPLVHLVRNAIDHGIETPQQRLELGKALEGCVRVSAVLRGNDVEICVDDDGAGLDMAALAQRAREDGYTIAAGEDPLQVAFLPGVSTAREVTGLSGRGIGLNAVRSAVDAVRGSVNVATEAGVGTRFYLLLPLTLAVLRAVLFEADGQYYAFNSALVERVASVSREQISVVEGRTVVLGDARPLPLVPFPAMLGTASSGIAFGSARQPILIVGGAGHRFAIAIDALVDERDLVLHSFGPRLSGLRSIAGVGVLGDTTLVLVMRSAFVIERAAALAKTLRSTLNPAPVMTPRKRILLVDDSLTARTLERSILEAAGYDIVTAGDGEEALRMLGERNVDLIVSDVDMPNLDGFALTAAVRASHHRDVPVVLVTARESDDDRRRGSEAGADAYVLKSDFDQRALIERIGELV